MKNVVSFPGLGLGLEFTLNRVAVTILGRPIYWYAIIIVCGFSLAWLYCSKKAPKVGLKSDDVVDLLLFAVPLAVIGARIYYIIFNLAEFRSANGALDFGKMVRIWDGGVAIYGAVITSLIVLFFLCRYKKVPFLAFADLGVFGLLIGQSVGRWGNFVNVECYGGVTDLPWRMCSSKIAAELYGQGLVDATGYGQVIDGTLGVHPAFLYESLWNLLGFVLLVLLFKYWRKFDGQMFFGYLVWYGVGRGIIEGMRTDSLCFMDTSIRVSQVLGFTSALIGVVLTVLFLTVWRRGPESLWVNRITKPESPADKEEANDGGDDN